MMKMSSVEESKGEEEYRAIGCAELTWFGVKKLIQLPATIICGLLVIGMKIVDHPPPPSSPPRKKLKL